MITTKSFDGRERRLMNFLNTHGGAGIEIVLALMVLDQALSSFDLEIYTKYGRDKIRTAVRKLEVDGIICRRSTRAPWRLASGYRQLPLNLWFVENGRDDHTAVCETGVAAVLAAPDGQPGQSSTEAGTVLAASGLHSLAQDDSVGNALAELDRPAGQSSTEAETVLAASGLHSLAQDDSAGNALAELDRQAGHWAVDNSRESVDNFVLSVDNSVDNLSSALAIDDANCGNRSNGDKSNCDFRTNGDANCGNRSNGDKSNCDFRTKPPPDLYARTHTRDDHDLIDLIDLDINRSDQSIINHDHARTDVRKSQLARMAILDEAGVRGVNYRRLLADDSVETAVLLAWSWWCQCQAWINTVPGFMVKCVDSGRELEDGRFVSLARKWLALEVKARQQVVAAVGVAHLPAEMARNGRDLRHRLEHRLEGEDVGLTAVDCDAFLLVFEHAATALLTGGDA